MPRPSKAVKKARKAWEISRQRHYARKLKALQSVNASSTDNSHDNISTYQKRKEQQELEIKIENDLTNTISDVSQQDETIQVINVENIINNTSPFNITEQLNPFNTSKELKNWSIQCKLNCENIKSLANILRKGYKNDISILNLATVFDCISEEESFLEKTSNNNDLNSISQQKPIEKTQEQNKKSVSTDISMVPFSPDEIFNKLPLNDRESYIEFEKMLNRQDVKNAYEFFIYDDKDFCNSWKNHLESILDKTFTPSLIKNIKWFGILEKLGIRSSKTIQLIIDKITDLYANCNRIQIENNVGVYFLKKQ